MEGATCDLLRLGDAVDETARVRRFSPVMSDATLSIALTWLSILLPVLAVLMILSTLID